MVPLRFWASYALGDADNIRNVRGNKDQINVGGAVGDIVSQRINVGAQINVINFPAFKFGAGAQLTVSHNEFQLGDDQPDPDGPGPLPPNPLGIGGGEDSIESGYGLQNVKLYGVARGRVLGIHGGYILDLGEGRTFEPSDLPGRDRPTKLANSDERGRHLFRGRLRRPE